MKIRRGLLTLVLLCSVQTAAEEGVFTGVTRLSCEALLCLSSGLHPSPCSPALTYYFAISKTTWPATFAARLAFLKICPAGGTGMATVVANGAGCCEGPALLNQLNAVSRFIGVPVNEPLDPNRYHHLIPQHCLAYFSHPLTADLLLPKPKKDCSQVPLPTPFGFNQYQMDPGASQSLCRLVWSW